MHKSLLCICLEWVPQWANGSEWILSLYLTNAYGAKSISDSLAVETLSFTSTAWKLENMTGEQPERLNFHRVKWEVITKQTLLLH